MGICKNCGHETISKGGTLYHNRYIVDRKIFRYMKICFCGCVKA